MDEEIKKGDRFLYKFGWFGTAMGGFLGLQNCSCILHVDSNESGELWFKDGPIWFSPVYPIDQKFMKLLKKVN